MDKFTSHIQVEESTDFQMWLDAQEVADLLAMEDEGKRELDEFDMRCGQEADWHGSRSAFQRESDGNRARAIGRKN